ncbi:conserved hypothetical protein [Hyella patelloides LEGE 07179]|uniref:DUF3134 domain-containing protein n=1 Tax=Hyella patelloides LEGE 07179 TaxID=945734 RepID=A0A563VJD9_9CYAN|nr:DUF3134 domain-containing protein [Hyella patelloides]VEP11576.1 conserved hypothetical protein [Hyella patelloides LEGE 07179]
MEKNPALSQEPRYEPAIVIPLKQESSLIDWLKSHNRLIPREPAEQENRDAAQDDVSELLSDDYEEEDDFDDDDDD